jgi:CIC family chloride channel protein
MRNGASRQKIRLRSAARRSLAATSDHSARVRTPRPLIPTRLPSGRGATEQPNAAGDAAAPLTRQFWLLLVVTAVATGLLGGLMMLLLQVVEQVAFGHGDSFTSAAASRSALRRVVVLAVGGAVCGLGWYLLRRFMPHGRTDLDDEVWTGDGTLSFARSLATSVVSEIAVGAGASLGKEAAPKLLGGASASLLARHGRLTADQRRLLVACGGGAGLACVYNVPLGGALLTAELLYGSVSLPVVMPALMCSWIATAVAWLSLGNRATYVNVPAYTLRPSHMVFALLAGPIIGVLAVAWTRLVGCASHHQARGAAVIVAPAAAFTLLGLLAAGHPELLGNGQDIVERLLTAQPTTTLGFMAALALLKPLVTALCLRSGASGGLFTPTLATGALVGGALGKAFGLAWPGAPLGSYALIGAAAMIGAAMQAPLTALAIVLELTHTADPLIGALIAATTLATATARYLDGYSIYSSRLPSRLGVVPGRNATPR